VQQRVVRRQWLNHRTVGATRLVSLQIPNDGFGGRPFVHEISRAGHVDGAIFDKAEKLLQQENTLRQSVADIDQQLQKIAAALSESENQIRWRIESEARLRAEAEEARVTEAKLRAEAEAAAEERRRQAHALIEALRTPEGLPTVLAGDFNTWWGATEPALNILRSAFPQTPRTPNLKTWSGPLGIHAQLDYMFIRGPLEGVQLQRLPSQFGSDHYPLLAVLDVGVRTADAPPQPVAH